MSARREWKEQIERYRRAGLDYIPRDRLIVPPPPIAPPASESQTPTIAARVTNVEPPQVLRPAPIPMPPVHSSPAIAATPMESTAAEKSENLQGESVPRKVASAKSNQDKNAALEILREEVKGCTVCPELASTRTQTVFSDGTPHAEVCFLGEAPGADEDRLGLPFVGAAGQLLTKIIEASKLQRSEVYICNVLKCRPPNNRPPLPEEMSNCSRFLERQLEIVQPKILVALGRTAAAFLLNQPADKVFITKIRGQIVDYRGIPTMITLHPAYLLRNPAAKKDVWEDMKAVMRFIGKPIDG